MFNIRFVKIDSEKEARYHIEKVGSDIGGVASMFRKTMTVNLKIHNLRIPQANILKQEMLAIGGDAAVAREVLINGCERTDVLLMGTLKQLHYLCKKLLLQPFSMKRLSIEIKEILSNIEKRDYQWKVKDRLINLGSKTLIMGVLNVTPDSFSDGGLFFDKDLALKQAERLIEDGADIIDIGGESTRPGAEEITAEEEIKRIIPLLETLRKKYPHILISVDTYKSQVADVALSAGADIINDISGLNFDPKLAEIVAKYGAGLILMHTRGKPKEMQKDLNYDDFMEEVLEYMRNSINRAINSGITKESLVVDPGIGFGKSYEHNLFILRRLKEFKVLGLPILIGTSRKSFIGKILNKEAKDRDIGTMATIAIAISEGASIVRVHNVAMAKDVVLVSDAIKDSAFL
ncbi:MAG: dihydropteroate synthase [Proteobacteria bacterium]|nr:dihydropteroate synthase [Pseudomonadota bacterium]